MAEQKRTAAALVVLVLIPAALAFVTRPRPTSVALGNYYGLRPDMTRGEVYELLGTPNHRPGLPFYAPGGVGSLTDMQTFVAARSYREPTDDVAWQDDDETLIVRFDHTDKVVSWTWERRRRPGALDGIWEKLRRLTEWLR
jgi:hypothetical protein